MLPAKLRWQSRDATYLRPSATEHPALHELADLGDAVPWSEFPVFKYWELESPADDVYVLAPFANGQPALVERRVGTGRVITMTTPVSDPAYDDPWNMLPTGPDPWPFLALANGIAEYLVGAGDTQLNYLAGQTAILRLAPERASDELRARDARCGAGAAIAHSRARPICRSRRPRHSATTACAPAGRAGSSIAASASIARPRSATSARIDFATIVDALGKDRVQLARSREEIEVRVGQGRVGRELFPALIIALALVLGVEQLLANRFYRNTA